jgi:uncharacterized protein with HEPN domain
MQPESADVASLLDMLQHAEGAIRAASGKTIDGYRGDENLRLAMERRMEIIGEAARSVSTEFQLAHSEIPWRQIIAQRHILAHEYGEVDDELIWRVVTAHLPKLVEQLRLLIPISELDGG